MRTLVISAAVALTLAGGPALAQSPAPDPAAAPSPKSDAKPAEKPKPHRRADTKGGALAVTIVNKRLVGLVELQVGPAGGDLAKVQGPLAFGRKAVAHLARTKDCLYDIKGHFADEADTVSSGVDLCKDKTINLTDE